MCLQAEWFTVWEVQQESLGDQDILTYGQALGEEDHFCNLLFLKVFHVWKFIWNFHFIWESFQTNGASSIYAKFVKFMSTFKLKETLTRIYTKIYCIYIQEMQTEIK